jgi:hypothetical protein
MAPRALLVSAVLLIALPSVAGAATVSVEPYADPPGTDPVRSCSHDRTRPLDMVALSAAPRISVPEVQADRVHCGRRRRDRAIAGGLDDPTGCEHVARPEFVDPDRPP